MLDWAQIDTVLLDMDGTLLDLHFDNYFWIEFLPQRCAHDWQLPLEEAKQRLFAQMDEKQGSLEWYCLDYWSRSLEINIPELKAEVRHLIAVRPYVEPFLSYLRYHDKQIILATNAHRDSLTLKMDATGISPYFDAIVSSHDYQAPKESQAFWQSLQAAFGFNKQRTLFIDDSMRVLDAAADYGIQHLLSLRQPDSKKACREVREYDSFLHFDELISDSYIED